MKHLPPKSEGANGECAVGFQSGTIWRFRGRQKTDSRKEAKTRRKRREEPFRARCSSLSIQISLPADLETACLEQCAFWFTNRGQLGLKTYWPSGLAYYQFAALDLLTPSKPPSPTTVVGDYDLPAAKQ